MAAKKDLATRVRDLPKSPGVYLFRGDDGSVLYVGKASSLRNRVRSYFQKPRGLSLKVRLLMKEARDLECQRHLPLRGAHQAGQSGGGMKGRDNPGTTSRSLRGPRLPAGDPKNAQAVGRMAWRARLNPGRWQGQELQKTGQAFG